MNKELDKITNILNNFLKQFDCTAKPGTDFACYTDSNTITYALVIADKYEKTFMDFTKRLFPNIRADPFLWSTMHEIGHIETENDFDEEDEIAYINAIKTVTTDEEYYNIPQEYAATDWAGTFMETHEEEIKVFWNKLAPAIQNFYTTLEVNK